ncbi:hypothetical protein SASPL_119548 [Salvia splendens]|uniref:Uncharacterized protein n=1 Tax=Salvia splendens TaxID=180675 RepID=A0A8X8ZT84_SALSN|nr:hypothetical protein SASPL_119548 [Salvia splendens]
MEESSLTQLEMDAVLQLIQLSSGDSESAADFHLLWLDFPKEIKQRVAEEEIGEESVGETTTTTDSSSSVINPEKLLEEALPRRRKRVLPLADIYRKTAPIISNSALKRQRLF